jgi:hypothetical protein
MASCYIEEYAAVGSGGGSYFAGGVPPAPSLAVQKIPIGAATQSAAFNDKTQMIAIVADGACHFSVGEDPTAAATTEYLPANTVRLLGVPHGYKISVAT